MSGIHGHIIGERKQLRAYAVDQRVIVSAGKIGAANPLPEKDIATEYQLLFLTIKTNAAGRMTGSK